MQPIPPQYGVPLDASQLNTNIPTSVLYGVTPTDEFIPIQVDDNGVLNTNATFSGTITIGMVGIQGFDTSGSKFNLGINSLGSENGYSLQVSLFDSNNHELVINSDGSLNTVFNGFYGSPVNIFSQVSAAPTVETAVLTYTVPAATTFSLTGVIAWGDYDGEFLIRVNSTLAGGGRNSPSFRTLTLDYESGPIIATAGQIVQVTITHYASTSQLFRANLFGGER